MSNRPQTIQIFLPQGDPRGIRVAEITTRIVQAIEVPRSLLSDFLKMPESKEVALYFLVGQSDGVDEPKVYIGQTSDQVARFACHNQDKDFWQRAVVVISKTRSLTQTHALLLEWLCIQEAKKAGRYSATNGNNGSRPHTPAPMEADCYEVFDTAKTLLATLGHPLFEPMVKAGVNQPALELLFCKGATSDGRGYYTEDGLVVLKGSSGRAKTVDSIKDTADERFRKRLIDSGVMQVQGDRVVFMKDHLFGSPSMAAVAMLGRTANGWNEWKDASGKTLHELKRVIPPSV
jgi:hypothetical protein